MPKKTKAKKATKTVNLNDLMRSADDGSVKQVLTVKPNNAMDWCEEDEPVQYDVFNLPSAPRMEQKNYDPSRIDASADKYFIRFSSLSYDVDEEQLRMWINFIEPSEIIEVNIPRGGDSGDDRYSGEGYMTVNSLDALSAVLSKDNENFNSLGGSRNRLQIEYRDKYGSWAQNPNSSRDSRGGFGRGGRDGDRRRGGRDSDFGRRDDEPRNWRDAPRRAPGGDSFNSFGGGRSGGDDFRRGPSSMDMGPPRQRKTLNLKKRTEPAPDNAVVASEIKEEPKPIVQSPSPSKQNSTQSEAPARSGPKSDPFGGAIPCDENKIRDAERRAEEKLARMQKSMEDSSDRRDRGGYRDERSSFDRDNRDNRYNDRDSRDDRYNSRDYDNRGGYRNQNSYDRDQRDFRSNSRDDFNNRRGSHDRYDNRGGYDDRRDEPPMERRKLNLKKRAETSEPKEDSPATSKANPFGAARPVDINVQLKREQEIEERKRKEREEAESKRDQRDASGRKILVLRKNRDGDRNDADDRAEDRPPRSKAPQEPRPMPQLQEKKKGIDVAQSKFAGLQLDDEGGNASSESESQGEEASGDN